MVKRRGVIWYFAHPYSVRNMDGTENMDGQIKKFEQCCDRAAMLLKAGFNIFAPICMTHPIHLRSPMPYETWIRLDEVFLEKMHGIILPRGEWEASKGCTKEREFFRARNLPILEIDFDHLAREIVLGKKGTSISLSPRASVDDRKVIS